MSDRLENMYRQHRQGLYTLALAITRCPQRAEDAVQEAFLRLWKRKVPAHGGVGYVFSAVRNAAIDQWRKTRDAGDSSVSASIFAAGADPAAAAAEAEQQALLKSALEELDDLPRQVVVMKIYAGLTFEQIAQAMEEPLQTVASRYRRALETLRESLGASQDATVARSTI